MIGTTTSFPPPRATIQNCSSPALRWKVKGSKAPPCFVLGAECPSPNLVKYGRGIYAPGLPPPPPLPAPRPPCPRTAPAPSGPAQPERTHANQREGTMENEPHQSRDRGTVCNEKRAILYGNEHVTMTLLLTSGSNHTIHIFVEHTAPHRRGGANKTTTGPTPQGGQATRHVTITNKRQQPYHTSVEHTAPPQAGRGQPKRPQASLHRGGGRRGKQQGQTRQLPT